MTAIQRIGLPRPIAALVTAVALLVAMIATPAGAQERFSGLTGTITDASGAVLPGATVAITNKQTGKVFTVVTGAGPTNTPSRPVTSTPSSRSRRSTARSVR